MYKSSIELARIGRLRVKFTTIIKDDEPAYKTGSRLFIQPISEFQFRGSDYLRIMPKSFVVLDISDSKDRGDSWNANMQFSMSKFTLYEFIETLTSMIQKFTSLKDLYYYKNDKLCIANEISNSAAEKVVTQFKTLKVQHSIVYERDNLECAYEGLTFMINAPENFCQITYTEAKYLYYVMKSINMDNLTMQLINLYFSMKNSGGSDGKKPDLTFPIIEETPTVERLPTTVKLNPTREIPEEL